MGNDSRDIDSSDVGAVPRKPRKKPTVVRRKKPGEQETENHYANVKQGIAEHKAAAEQIHIQKVVLEGDDDNEEGAAAMQVSDKYKKKPIPKPRRKPDESPVEVYDQG